MDETRHRFAGPLLWALLLISGSLPAADAQERAVIEGRVPSTNLELRVNIPAFRLDALVEGEVVASFPVTVGARHEPTPDGGFVIDKVIWNPWWHPPAHRRPKDRVTPPGPRNPMGRVKLHFAADLYYVHGTSNLGQIREPASRGCIRLANEDAIALAGLVHDLAGPDLEELELVGLMRDSSRTRELPLDRPVPLRIVYEVVEIGQGYLALHEDVYRRWGDTSTSEILRAALESRGLDPSRVDLTELETALGASPANQVILEILPGGAVRVEAAEGDLLPLSRPPEYTPTIGR